MSDRPFPDWQQRAGLNFGPQGLANGAAIQQVEIYRAPFQHSDNPRELTVFPLDEISGEITATSSQVIQVIPNGNYDVLAVSIRAKDGGLGNRCYGYWGKILNQNGKGNYPYAATIPVNQPDFVSDAFNEMSYFRLDVPLGTLPFWLHFRNSGSNNLIVVVSLLTLGF